MHRLDPLCKSLLESLDNKELAAEARGELRAQLEKREKQLLPVYHQARAARPHPAGSSTLG